MKIGCKTLAVCLCLLAASCSNPNQAPSIAVQEEAKTTPTLTKPEQQATTTVLNFALGSFVDPSTYAIGGQSSEFTQDDNLYGVIDFSAVLPGDSVGMRIVNANGETEAESMRSIEGVEQKSINFDFGIPKNKRLTPGIYKIEIMINGVSSQQSEITIK